MIKMSQHSVTLLALLSVLLFSLFGSSRSYARGCHDPLANVGCTVAECEALQANVNATKGAIACRRVSGCGALQFQRQRWLDHYQARNIINNRCYAGGDWEHQDQAANAISHVGKCDARIALPEPEGCADPCPGE